MEKICNAYEDGPDKEAIVNPSIFRSFTEEDLGSNDAPQDRQRVEVLCLERSPGL